ncbi:hypothetical protein [Dyella acidiphila]|uniref:Uncharacterized protein n=1 Tax=Dyella acidiphila TaxID=2775866 RepID=A0ABR9G744_9GAMM|nr:hypothetical protein [Dyella acidiphila]MBE1159869.1 hypothetical protein [Dyella acidiphila]
MLTRAPHNDPTPPLQRWNGALPLLMTGAVLVMIALDLLRHGLHAPHHDEGSADHIAIFLMFGQLPVVASLLITGRKEIRRIAPVLAAQIIFWLLTYLLAWMTR